MAGFIEQRRTFVRDVNHAFSAEQIEQTTVRLQAAPHSDDALDLMHRLELLHWLEQRQHARYRETLGIPALNMHILTLAFRAALNAKPPLPVSFDILEGAVEGVTVLTAPDRITIHLTRTGFEPELPKN